MTSGFIREEARWRVVDERRVETVLDDLERWGVVETEGPEVRPTRRFVARLQANAEKLNLIAAKGGAPPAGNPLVVAVSQTLANENLSIAPDDFDDYVAVLVLLELSRMTPAKRANIGFADVLFPGESPPSAGDTVGF